MMSFWKPDLKKLNVSDIYHTAILMCLLVLITINIVSCNGPLEPFTGEHTRPAFSSNLDSLYSAYSDDAAHLAVEWLYMTQSPDTSKILIPEHLINVFHSGLRSIIADTNYPESDSVVSLYNIHTFRDPSVHYIWVIVDTAARWSKYWQEGERMTREVGLDRLMNTYEITLVDFDTSFSDYAGYDVASLRSRIPVNTKALANAFSTHPSIISARPRYDPTDGNDLRAWILGNEILYEFSVGWGDCILGCIGRYG